MDQDRWIGYVPVLLRPSPNIGRVGIHDFPFGACSGFTRVTACQIAAALSAYIFPEGFSRTVSQSHCLGSYRDEPTISRAELSSAGNLGPRGAPTYTVKNYMSTLRQFILWIDIPVESVSNKKLLSYIDHLQRRRLAPKTINSHLDSIRGFYNYLIDEEQVQMANPVKRGYALRLSRPLPRYLMDEDVARLFSVIENRRDRAIFMLMLRCGLRVEEIAKLTLAAIDFKRSQLFVFEGKGGKGRVVYLSRDAQKMLEEYLRNRPPSRSKRVFLVEEKTHRGKPISVRGIQKRMKYYAGKAGIKASCH